MINLITVSPEQFLQEYWQKKTLVIRQALPGFVHLISADELAGLAMEEEVESRLVFHTPQKAPFWQLKRGPFSEGQFMDLPHNNWTLLVQGVDRFIPHAAELLDNFNLVPNWRFDDLMISYAVKNGSVGPHYDNYDVFLYQALGKRRWLLTTKGCYPENYLENLELRIMKDFSVEEEYLLEEGDMLYLPPHVGHYGIAESDECMTYSFGYRSYQQQELLESLTDYLAENVKNPILYKDPQFKLTNNPNQIPDESWLNARQMLLNTLDNPRLIKDWFAQFITKLDQQAEVLMDDRLEQTNDLDVDVLLAENGLMRNPLCRFAYYRPQDQSETLRLYINGTFFDIGDADVDLVTLIADNRVIETAKLKPYLFSAANRKLINQLWQLNYLELIVG